RTAWGFVNRALAVMRRGVGSCALFGVTTVLMAQDPALEPIPLPMPQTSTPASPGDVEVPEADAPLHISPITPPTPLEIPSDPSTVAPEQVLEFAPGPVVPEPSTEPWIVAPSPVAPGVSTTVVRRTVFVLDPRWGIVRPVSVVTVQSRPTLSVTTMEHVTVTPHRTTRTVHYTSHVGPSPPVVVTEELVIAELPPSPYVPGQPLRNAIRRRWFP
ncbi:MAG TPA: hypothetical protein VIY86_05515, partial [Pirellulaceae bacterium]